MADALIPILDALVESDRCSDAHAAAFKDQLIGALSSSDESWADFAISQVQSYQHAKSRALIDTTQSTCQYSTNLIVAEINQRFAPHLNFEWIRFEDAQSTPRIHEKFPSKSRPIKILDSSENLAIKQSNGATQIRSVVLFPEDWRWPASKMVADLNAADVLFFVDRFALRTKTYSWPLLKECISESTFRHLRSLLAKQSEDIAERLCSVCLGPHERNHRTGKIPCLITEDDDFRLFKDNRDAGGFEELRADVNAMLELHSRAEEDGYELCVAEFICLERLFRYPVQHLVEKQLFDPHKRVDYDSISSQLIVRFLRHRGYLNTTNGKAVLAPDYVDGLREFAQLAEHIESGAIEAACETDGDEWAKKGAGREFISRFVKRFVGYDSQLNDYHVDRVFESFARAVFPAVAK